MRSSSSLFSTLIFVSASFLAVQADVFPNFPAGDIINAGTPCAIKWAGDTNATTLATGAWKQMTIELMTGDNLAMVHLTTVATGQDGTTDGSFSWTCPEVTPNADIYFYQFRAPGTPDYQWTTRFTIASDSGATVAPANATQPDGSAPAWGTGALVDPSTAVAAPVFSAGVLVGASSTAQTGAVQTGGAQTGAQTGATGTASQFATNAPSATSHAPSSASNTAIGSTGNSTSSTSNNAASSKSALVDFHFVHAALILVASAMGFTLL